MGCVEFGSDEADNEVGALAHRTLGFEEVDVIRVFHKDLQEVASMDLSRSLFLLGAAPYMVLGVAHALATPLTPDETKGLSPRSPALRQSMTTETVVLTRRTSLWLAWVGFNLSHSLGAVLFGVVVLLVGRTEETFRAGGAVFLPLASIVSGLYLLIGLRYWFRTPIVGIALATSSFLVSWAIRMATSP